MSRFQSASQINRAARAAAERRRVWYVMTSWKAREPKTRQREKTKTEEVKPCEG